MDGAVVCGVSLPLASSLRSCRVYEPLLTRFTADSLRQEESQSSWRPLPAPARPARAVFRAEDTPAAPSQLLSRHSRPSPGPLLLRTLSSWHKAVPTCAQPEAAEGTEEDEVTGKGKSRLACCGCTGIASGLCPEGRVSGAPLGSHTTGSHTTDGVAWTVVGPGRPVQRVWWAPVCVSDACPRRPGGPRREALGQGHRDSACLTVCGEADGARCWRCPGTGLGRGEGTGEPEPGAARGAGAGAPPPPRPYLFSFSSASLVLPSLRGTRELR